MSVSATVLTVNGVFIATTDKRTRTTIASVAAAMVTPFFLIFVVILSALSGTASHNNAAVSLTFHGGYLSSQLPVDYRMYIEKMRSSFADLDTALSEIDGISEGEEVDSYRAKAIFYALFFGAEQPQLDDADYRMFADCFVVYEDRKDMDGKIQRIAIPVKDLEIVYENLFTRLGLVITQEDKSNASRIYTLAKYGQTSPENALPLGLPMDHESYTALIAEAEKYLGYPYVWGGSSPETSFDCSGFVCWVYTQSGVWNLPRTTATGIYYHCAMVPKEQIQPGDLIFFTKTYMSSGPVSHVGIYVGGNQMLHCGSPIQYTNIDSDYWKKHFYAIGRLPR